VPDEHGVRRAILSGRLELRKSDRDDGAHVFSSVGIADNVVDGTLRATT
jgi:hypothetical protein